MKRAIQTSGRPTDTVYFDVLVVIDRMKPTLTKFKAVCGPDDDGRPCITIMYPHED